MSVALCAAVSALTLHPVILCIATSVGQLLVGDDALHQLLCVRSVEHVEAGPLAVLDLLLPTAKLCAEQQVLLWQPLQAELLQHLVHEHLLLGGALNLLRVHIVRAVAFDQLVHVHLRLLCLRSALPSGTCAVRTALVGRPLARLPRLAIARSPLCERLLLVETDRQCVCVVVQAKDAPACDRSLERLLLPRCDLLEVSQPAEHCLGRQLLRLALLLVRCDGPRYEYSHHKHSERLARFQPHIVDLVPFALLFRLAWDAVAHMHRHSHL